MDLLLAAGAVGAGTFLGLLAGCVPGLHPNTFAPLALPLAAILPPAALAAAVAAMAAANAVSAIVPVTFLGAPDEGHEVAVLPSQRLAAAGFAPEALAASASAAALGIVASSLLLHPAASGLVAALLAAAAPNARPAALCGMLLVLAATSRSAGRPDAGRFARNLLTMAAAGVLGVTVRDLPLRSLLPLPPSPLGPALSGLFAVPPLLALLVSGRGATPRPSRPEAPPVRAEWALRGGAGLLAGALPALFPGITSGAGGGVALAASRRPGAWGSLVLLSAAAGTSVGATLGVLFATGRVRSGLAATLSAGGLPLDAPTAAWAAVGLLFAAALSALALLAAARPLGRMLGRVGGRRLAAGALAVLLALTLATTGPAGLALLSAGTLIGAGARLAGARPLPLLGFLLLPAALG